MENIIWGHTIQLIISLLLLTMLLRMVVYVALLSCINGLESAVLVDYVAPCVGDLCVR